MLEGIFELGMNLVETLIILDFVTRYLGCKYGDFRKYVGFIAFWMIGFAELSYINYLFSFEGLAVFLPIVIVFIYELLFLNGKVLMKLWISALTQIIVIIIAVGTNLFVCYVIDYDPNDMINVFNATRIISVVITKVILFYVTRVLLRRKYKNPLGGKQWIVLIVIPLISLASLVALMIAALNNEEMSGYILCGMAGILLVNVSDYYLFSTLNRDYELKLKINMLEQNNENAVKNIENSKAFVNRMKSARHDMKNQLLIISGMIKSGKSEEAEKYIKKLTDDFLPEVRDFINSDNEAFNAIANAKAALCYEKKIFLEIREMKNSLKDFDAVDTGILFGNLLDNAIEAAEKTNERRITVDIKTQGLYLSILVTNSIDHSVLEENSALETTKKDKAHHGTGIRTLKELVKKYNGMIQFFEEDGEFCCHIMLMPEKELKNEREN